LTAVRQTPTLGGQNMNETKLIGKTVIVGISYYDENGKFLDQKQFHGQIIGVSSEAGIRYIDKETNDEHVLPLRVDAIFPAPKGCYREYTTHKIINDPDFISLWHVQKKAGTNDNWEWLPYRADLRVKGPEKSER
jgi:hypothetical protein